MGKKYGFHLHQIDNHCRKESSRDINEVISDFLGEVFKFNILLYVPFQGLVIVSPDPNHDILRHHTGCHFLNTTLRVFWTGFHDDESQIAGFRVAIGRSPLGYDVLPFRDFNIDSEAKFELNENYGLSQGDTIFATVEATNKAGLTTKVSSPATRLLSDKDSTLLHEGDFQCVNV